MKRNWLALTSIFLSLVLFLTSGSQHKSGRVANAQPTLESASVRAVVQPSAPGVPVSESVPAKASAEPAVVVKNPLPEISFEKTVCDLGLVGLGTKNTCEFRFTNPGQALLKITNVKSTCGCTVAKLDKKEYAPGQSGTIKVTYTAPRTASTAARHIYVSTNDTSNPNPDQAEPKRVG